MMQIEPGVDLTPLDPGVADSEYWDRFQLRVMASVGPRLRELARAPRTITWGEVVVAWGRVLVPGAALAAAVATFVLLQSSTGLSEFEFLAGIEEVLALSSGGEEPLPSFLHSDAVVDRNLVLYAVEGM